MIHLKNIMLLVLSVFVTQGILAQRYSVHKRKHSFIELTGGMNFSMTKVKTHYSVVSSMSQSAEEFDKKYDKMSKNIGSQFGIRYTYAITNSFSFLTGVGYQNNTYKYFSDFKSIDTINNMKFEREMHHIQKISYIHLPFLLRWEMSNSQLSPYLQAGFFMDFRHQAKKKIIYDNTIDGEETENQTTETPSANMTDHLKKFNFGLTGGVGVSYYAKALIFGIESNFNFGFRNTVNDRNRYADLTGFTLQYLDVLDQLKISNLNLQLSVKIPINHSKTLNILRKRRY